VISDAALADSLHLVRAALGPVKWLLALKQLTELHDRCADSRGGEFASAALRELGIEVVVDDRAGGVSSAGGPVVVVCNHPFGLLDGLVVINVLSERGCRFKILGNHLLSGIEPLAELFFFVNAFDDKRGGPSNVPQLRAILRADDDVSLVMFPAGDVSSFRLGSLRVEDRSWATASAKLVKKLDRPVVPLYVDGRNSVLYQVMTAIHPRLGLLRLPRELLNKRGRSVRVVVGKPFRLTPAELSADAPSLADALRRSVYRLRERVARTPARRA
jgi:putative hemolysin